MPTPSKNYSQHIRDAQYCSLQWRILFLKPDFNEQHSTDFKKFRVVPVYCNSKACPRCARRKYSELRRRFKDVSRLRDYRFFTLTSKKTEEGIENDLIKLEDNFRELRKKLKRKFPELHYIAVKELSPSGMWHYHGLWNIYIDITELSKIWEEISGAYRVYLEKVKNPTGAINYIFKYCFKSIHNDTERRTLYECNRKKFTTSRGMFDQRKLDNPYTSEIGISYSVDEIKEKLYSIILSSDCTVDDFSGDSYPYFDDLILNLFHKFVNEHPPNLFDSRLASLGAQVEFC